MANGSEYVYVRLVKAYRQKKGTTTMKCAASAESDAFVQAVVLFIAVIPQIARRCDLLVWLLLRAATIAFTTRLWDIQQEKVFLMVSDSGLTKSFGKGHFYGCRPEM